jgi:membrane protein implicated in regulation of membrane protease activity
MAGSVALIVIGLLIFIPSGLCTGIMVGAPIVQAILHPSYSAGALGMLPIALMFGLPFVTVGAIMIYRGISRIRERHKAADRDNPAA